LIVVDASVALEVLLHPKEARALQARLLDPAETLHAPHLIDLEIAQVLRRYVRSGDATAGRCDAAIDDWLAFPVRRYPHELLLPRVWALRHVLSAYDATYVALAEALGAALITKDARIAQATGHAARIEVA